MMWSRNDSCVDPRAVLVALVVCSGLACSAGATQYADDEREGTGAGAPVSEFGTALPPAGTSPGNALAQPPGAAAPVTPPPASSDTSLEPAPLPASDDVPPAASAGGNDGTGEIITAPADDGVGGAMTSGEVASTGTCALAVSVTTVPPGGRYTPRNVGAIWIADGEGGFIKSLDVWGNRRLRHLEAWNAATEAAGSAANVVDAVTGATENAHGARGGTWNCRDFGGQVVPDGKYRVYFEVTESNGAGPSTFANFTKGPDPQTVLTAAPSFNDISLTFTP